MAVDSNNKKKTTVNNKKTSNTVKKNTTSTKKKTNSTVKKTAPKKNNTSLNDLAKEVKKKELALEKEKNTTPKEEMKQEKKVPKEEVVFEDNSSVFLNTEYVNKKKRNDKLLIWFAALVFLLCLMVPRIKILGDNPLTINYNEEYIEPGYKSNILFFNITKYVTSDNNIDNKVIGEYKVNYYLDLKVIKMIRTRIVMVVDKKEPVIEYDGDEIKICPNKEDIDIDYKAIDEYDGDLTDKVIEDYDGERLLLLVSDKSNNIATKELKVIKKDDEKPVITLKGNATIYLNYGTKYVEPGYSANDNCDGDITNKVSVSGTVGSNIGTYTVTYKVSDSAQNEATITRKVIIRSATLYNSGTIGNGVIYLTFDDGPSNGTTNVILDILKSEGVKATFFVTCNGPDSLIKRMYDEGHTVALHTATHNYSYIYSSTDNYFADLNRVSTRVKNITGVESKIIRFPGGSSNTVSRNYKMGIMTDLTRMVLERGYRYFDWNVDARDASTARSSSDVYYNVINNLSKSRANVVLMHDIKPITRDALRNIIRTAKSNGYTFSKIDMNTYMVRHGVNN